MQSASEKEYKYFQFTMIINFYAPLFGGKVHKSSI